MADDRSVENALAVKDDDGLTIVRVALALTVYFEGAHLAPVRRAVADCVADFAQMAGPRIRWVKNPTTFEWRETGDAGVAALDAWLQQLDPMKGWELDMHGGDDPNEAADLSLSALGLASWRPAGLSYLKLTLPLTWFADHSGSLPELALRVCRRLAPRSGYGGLGFVDSPDPALHNRSDPLIYTLAQRFVGIEVDDPVSHSLDLADHIKGVNWLTVLGDPMLERLGGRDGLRGHLLPPATLLDFDGGAIVQAGPRPQFGDREAGRDAPEYAAVNRLLKPLRVASLVLQKGGRGPRFDKAASEAWLARFD